MKPLFLHTTYGILDKGMRLFVARIVYSTKKVKGSMFKKDGFALYHRYGELRIRMPHKLYQGRRLRRFLKDFVKSMGGIPRTIDFWIVPYK